MKILPAILLCLGLAFAATAETRPQIFTETLKLMQAAAQQLPNVTSAEIDMLDQSLTTTLSNGQTIKLNPDNLHLQLQTLTTDADRDAEVAHFMATLVPLIDAPTQLDQASLLHIFPVIRPSDYDVSVPGLTAEDTPLNAEFLPGLSVFYVLDTPQNVQYLTTDMLRNTGIGLDVIKDAATVNIARYAAGAQIFEGTISVVKLDGFYESSLLLVPAIWEDLDQDVDKMVIALPARDILVFGDGKSPEIIAQMNLAIQKVKEVGAGLLTDRLLVWENHHWAYAD